MSGRLLVGLVATVLAGACRTGEPTVGQVAGALPDSADQVGFGVHTLLTHEGLQRMDLTADTSYSLDNSTKYDLRNVHIIMLNEMGKRAGTVTARKGIYLMREQQLEGFGDVVAVSDSTGARLTTQYLRYDQATDRISTDSAFVVTKQGQVQRGVGFDADSKLTRVNCHAQCRNY